MKNLIIILSILLPNLLFAQLVNDMKVNLDTNIYTTAKYYSSVSSNVKGNTVVTWEVNNGMGERKIFIQIFDSLFNRVGDNFSLNSISGYEGKPFVSVRKDGSFGIVWTGLSSNPYGSKILLKIYNKNGIPISSEIQLNEIIIGYDGNYSICTDSLGRFIVTFDYAIPTSARPNVYFQIVDSNGVKIGSNVKVNQYNSYGTPSIAVSNNGSFVIAWCGSPNVFPKTIYCQLYSRNGLQIGNNVQVNENGSDPIDDRSYPEAAFDSSGNFVVGFKEIPYSTGVARIKYQRFDSNGDKIGINKIINANSYVYQLSSDEDGNLIFLLSFNGTSGYLYNLRIDKNDNSIGSYFLASNQLPNVVKGGTDVVMKNKKFINLWRDLRLSNHPQVFLNVRSYTNPDSVVFVHNISIEIPSSYSLSQNYPNPFNPMTKINFDLPKQGFVSLKIFDITGREVQTLVNEFQLAGKYTVDFNGSALSSGVYFYRLQSGELTMTKSMVLIR